MKNTNIYMRVSEKEKERITKYSKLFFDDRTKFILYCVEKEILNIEKKGDI